MIKGGRQAKLQAKENQAVARAEKLFQAFNKDSLQKLRNKIMNNEAVIDSKTPTSKLQNGASRHSKDIEVKAKHNFSRTYSRKSTYLSFLMFRRSSEI